MKRKILMGIAVMTIVVIPAFNVNMNTKSEESLLTLANVEALAQETDTGARSCSLSWTVGIFGIGGSRSCSVTCDIGFNAQCLGVECKCVPA